MKSKHLILFTAQFPYGRAETFLETEILFLSEAFEKIVIVSQASDESEKRSVPSNCEVIRNPIVVNSFDRLMALSGVLSSDVWKEKNIALKEYGCSYEAVMKTLLISNYRAQRIAGLAKQLIKKFPQNSVVCYSYWSDDAAIGLAMLRAENPNLRCISRAHGWDMYFEASAVGYLPFRRFLGRNLDRVFTISEKGKQYAIDRWGVSPDKLEIARLGVKKQKFHENAPEVFTIVSCSSLIPLKRVHLIVEALSLLPKSLSFKWMHFGGGVLLNEVKDLAAEKLPIESFEFKGQVSNEEVLEWYRKNSVSAFVNVSTTEGVPVSIMEAMSFGIPSIATDVGGNSEIVNADNGVLLGSDPTAEEIANAFVQFSELTDVVSARRLNALDTWNKKYNAADNYTSFASKLVEI